MAAMEMIDRLQRALRYAGLEPDLYHRITEEAERENGRTLRFAALLQMLYFGISFAMTFTVHGMEGSRLIYGFVAVLPVILIVVYELFGGRHPRIRSVVDTVFTFGLLFAALMNTLWVAPDDLSVTLPVLFFAVAMLFTEAPYRLWCTYLLIDIIYMLFAPQLKPPEVLGLDTVDILLFSSLSLILGTKLKMDRFRRLALEKTARDLAQLYYDSAYIDRGTGLFNHTAFRNDMEAAEAEHPQPDTVFIAMDVNGLKAVNDTLEHAAGDELIAGAGACMRACFGAYGKVYRTGGDEFCAVIRADDAQMDSLRTEFEKTVAAWSGDMVKELSVSFGFVTAREKPDATLHAMSVLADHRMYASKSVYYHTKGADRRAQRDASEALRAMFVKILKADLTEDTYRIVNMDDGEQSPEDEAAYRLSEWLKSFGVSGQVHPDDLDMYLRRTDVPCLRDHFAAGGDRLSIAYRRRQADRYVRVVMELIPTRDNAADHVSIYLYVRTAETEVR